MLFFIYNGMSIFEFLTYLLPFCIVIIFVFVYIIHFSSLNVYAIIMIPIAIIGAGYGLIKHFLQRRKKLKNRKNQ